MGYHNALWISGGAGGKDHIGRIHIQHLPPPGIQKSRVGLALQAVLYPKHRIVPQLFCQLPLLFLIEHRSGLQLPQHPLHPGLGHFLVHGHIIAPTGQHPQHRRQGHNAPVRQYRHRTVCPGDCLCQRRTNGTAPLIQPPKGHGLTLIGECDLVPQPPGCMFQIFQQIFLHIPCPRVIFQAACSGSLYSAGHSLVKQRRPPQQVAAAAF